MSFYQAIFLTRHSLHKIISLRHAGPFFIATELRPHSSTSELRSKSFLQGHPWKGPAARAMQDKILREMFCTF